MRLGTSTPASSGFGWAGCRGGQVLTYQLQGREEEQEWKGGRDMWIGGALLAALLARHCDGLSCSLPSFFPLTSISGR
jgi:hypothetical protein